MRKSTTSLAAMSAVLMAAAAMPSSAMTQTRRREPTPDMNAASQPSNRYPQMVTSTPAEIAEHNAACDTRQVRRNRARHAA